MGERQIETMKMCRIRATSNNCFYILKYEKHPLLLINAYNFLVMHTQIAFNMVGE